MKKIISLILVLCSVFTMFACGKKNASVEQISEIINQSDPTKIVTVVNYTVGGKTYVGKYTTQKDLSNGKQQFDYEYQRKSVPGEDDPSSSVTTVSGTVYQNEAGERFGSDFTASSAPGYLPYSLNLAEKRFSSFTVSEDGKSLEAFIPSAEAIRVFGTEVSAEGDITLKITTNGEYLYSIQISYVAAGTGANVVINTSYDYANIKLNF